MPPIDGGRPQYHVDPAEHRELAQELSGMAESIREVDPRAAERLTDLGRSLVDESGRGKWADVDLRRAFNTEWIAHAWAVRKVGGYASASIEIAARLRNVLVLAPLAVTWYAFHEASKAYDRYLAENPEETGTPMLVLWERGFGGELSRIHQFSSVALVAFVIIGIIILLTFYSEGRRDQRDDDIMMTAGRFQADLDNALGAATVALAPDRAGRPAMLAQSVERLATRFDQNSQELLDRLSYEHDRLAELARRREKEFADFAVFASGMRAGAEETHRLILEMRNVSVGLHNSLEDLASEVGMANDQQRTLLQAVNQLERLVSNGIQSDQAVTRQLSDAAANLAEAADRALAGSEAAAQAGRVASEAVRGIAELTVGLVDNQDRVEKVVGESAEANTRLAEALRGSVSGVSASTKQLTEISVGLAELRQEFGRLGDQGMDQTSLLNSILGEQSGVADRLSEAARNLNASAMAVAQRQREVKDEIDRVLDQLGGVSNTLHRFANHLPTVEALQHAFQNALRQELHGSPALPPPPRSGGTGPLTPPRRQEPAEAGASRAGSERANLWPSQRRPGQ